MPRLSLWNGRHGRDYQFIDHAISEYFGVGGTEVRVWLYLGPYLGTDPQVTTSGTVVPAYDPNDPNQLLTGGITTIQDPILGETRDRHYSPVPVELRGIYNVSDLDFDLRQFGLFLANDTVYIEFHLQDMIARCGRKIIPGDVLELPHRRDTGLDPSKQIASNKFYLVDDASRASDGYSATWWPHIWRVKASPLTNGQEFGDILNQAATDQFGLPIVLPGGSGSGGSGSGAGGSGGSGAGSPATIGSLVANTGVDLALNTAIDTQAKQDVTKRYFDTRQYWMLTPEGVVDSPWIFAGDGEPPNGSVLVGSGNQFPSSPHVGDYYLRTDYAPETLFMWNGRSWQIQEYNNRPNWSAAYNALLSFINNDNITTNDDRTTAPEKTNLSRVVRPRADF